MTPTPSGVRTQNSIWIPAAPETVYHAFTDPAALEVWLAPGEMTGRVHNFDLRVGGGYSMSLYYPASDESSPGKTAEREDRYTARYVELDSPRKIAAAITFDTPDPAFSGVMIMEVTLQPEAGGTAVTIAFSDIPPGIRPEDNELGTQLSLEKLKRYVAQCGVGLSELM